ncbi:MAG: glycosyltransferase [Pseudomonadota bacterium]|nr:glycosyltransferase [Pseudomonadota bacterium]
MNTPTSLQMVGSKALGGAERWFLRFTAALAERQAPAELAIRSGSELDTPDLPPLPLHRLPFLTVWDPISRKAVSRLIRRLKPDIVQTYMGRATRLAHLAPSTGPVHVARLGGYYRLHPYRHAHAWIGNTKGLCDWMVKEGLPADRVFHIYNFVDPAHAVPPGQIAALRAELGLPADAWVMVTAGRFVPVKGHRVLLEALSLLPAAIGGRPLRLVLMGDGVLGPRLREQADAAGIADRLVWAGWRTDPTPFYQMADLVVFPSLEEETLGNVILEAWSWTKPLVTSLFRGAREIARHGEDAFCVPCADAPGLARGIAEVLGDPAMGEAMAERGHARVQTEFGRDPIMDQYLDLYRRLAGG